jgi:hypothetical protein
MNNYTMENLPGDNRFIQVSGEDGIFYDCVRTFQVSDHVKHLKDGGYLVELVSRKAVPPCIFRDLTGDLKTYIEATWNNGTDFYIRTPIAKLTCLRCGHIWVPRADKLPKVCPNGECKSPYWNKPRKEK